MGTFSSTTAAKISADNGLKVLLIEKFKMPRYKSCSGVLIKKAMKSGAQVRDCTSAIACEAQEGYVTVTLHGKDTYTEQAKFVIDCEGVVGSLKRKLIKNNCDYITTFQTFNKGIID